MLFVPQPLSTPPKRKFRSSSIKTEFRGATTVLVSAMPVVGEAGWLAD